MSAPMAISESRRRNHVYCKKYTLPFTLLFFTASESIAVGIGRISLASCP